MKDTKCRHTVHPDWEREMCQLGEELKKTRDLLNIAECQIAEQSKTITFLEGQIRAFEFCVARGGNKNS